MVLWIAILFLLFLFIMQKSQLDLTYWREGEMDLLTIVLRGPFNVALYRGELSIADLMMTDGGPKAKVNLMKQDRLQGVSKESEEVPVENLGKIKRLLQRILPSAKIFKPLVKQLLKQARLEKLVWKTEFGTSNAALTGVSVGLAWILHGWLMAILQNEKGWTIEPENIDFVPVFDKACFSTFFHCILSIRIAHVITAQFQWLKLKLRQRKR